MTYRLPRRSYRPPRNDGNARLFQQSQFDDCEKDFLGRKNLRSSREWLEHHANIFAALLLMPRIAFNSAVIKIQKEMGINRNVGKIFLDGQKSNYRDFINIVSCLQKIFSTSNESIKIRLKELQILHEASGSKLLHISSR